MALLDQGSYGAQLSSAATFTGVLKSITIPINSLVFDGTGSPAVDATDTSAPNSGSLQASLANSDNTVGFSVVLPGDYDSRTYDTDDLYPGDTLKVRVLAVSATAAETLEIDDIVYTREGATAATDPTLSSAQSASQTVALTTYDVYEFDLSGLGLYAGDAVSIHLGCTVAGGGTIVIRGIELVYRGHIVNTDSTRR